MKKGVIYEVKLLDWVERIDIEADGNFLKTFILKAEKKEYEKPTENDEITINVKAFYTESQIIFERSNWETKMGDEKVSGTLRKILESMKRGEKAIVQVKSSFL